MLYRHQLITPPALEPITLAEAKRQLLVEHGDDDALITGLIIAARMHVEEVCWRGLVTQTWEIVMDRWPSEYVTTDTVALSVRQFVAELQNGVELGKGNLSSVVSVKYLDLNGTQQTLATSEYLVDAVSVPGRIRNAYFKSWPEHREQWDAIRVQFIVGWAVASVPQPIKQAIMLLVSQMYENRVPEITGTMISQLEFAVDALLRPYRLVRHT